MTSDSSQLINPYFQNEAKGKTFLVKMSFISEYLSSWLPAILFIFSMLKIYLCLSLCITILEGLITRARKTPQNFNTNVFFVVTLLHDATSSLKIWNPHHILDRVSLFSHDLVTIPIPTLETRRKLGRVHLRKDFWECY